MVDRSLAEGFADTEDRVDEKDTIKPDAPQTFEETKLRLAQNLVHKTKEFEERVSTLPGIGRTEVQQEEKIRELQRQLAVIEERRTLAVEARRQAQVDLEHLIAKSAAIVRSAN